MSVRFHMVLDGVFDTFKFLLVIRLFEILKTYYIRMDGTDGDNGENVKFYEVNSL